MRTAIAWFQTRWCLQGSGAKALKQWSGVTLVELLISLAILSLLYTSAQPSLTSLLNTFRLRSAVQDFHASVLLARSEAILGNTHAVMCKSASGRTCDDTNGWEQGWIVFHDRNGNAQRDVGEAVLLHQQALGGATRVLGNQNVAKFVVFNPTGETRNGTITFCTESAKATQARQLVLYYSGRPRLDSKSVVQCPERGG